MSELLNYASPPPWHRRRRVRRWAGVSVVGLVVVCAIWWREPLWFQARMHYWEWRCATYTAPADQIVFASDTATVKALSGDRQYTKFRGQKGMTVLRTAPPCFTEWSRLAGINLWTGRTPAVMHKMQNGHGESRLLVLAWGPATQRTFVLKRDSQLGTPVLSRAQCHGDIYCLVSRNEGRLRVYAGQVDPADPSRLTLRFEVDGQTGYIEGRLGEDDRLDLKVHCAPIAQNQQPLTVDETSIP